MTKLAGSSFHLSIFLAVNYLTFSTGNFQLDMWALYAAVAVGHAGFDKTLATVRDIKERRIAVEAETRP